MDKVARSILKGLNETREQERIDEASWKGTRDAKMLSEDQMRNLLGDVIRLLKSSNDHDSVYREMTRIFNQLKVDRADIKKFDEIIEDAVALDMEIYEGGDDWKRLYFEAFCEAIASAWVDVYADPEISDQKYDIVMFIQRRATF